MIGHCEYKVVYESDWLASSPYFYNTRTNKHSKNINDVIDSNGIEINENGLKAYLFCGYSICGHTPAKNVHFLPPHSRLLEAGDGTLVVETLPDPVEKFLDYRLSEGEIFELLRHKVQSWENKQRDTIVIPTSGGYDSRLLNYMVKDKSRIRSITYGISCPQENSHEVIYSGKLSELLHTNWMHIELGRFHDYLGDWYKLYGISTHAHGMYHMEFFGKYLQNFLPTALLSGVIGDAWAKMELPAVLCPSDVYNLAYTHSTHVEHSWLAFTSVELFEEYFERKKDFLKDSRMRVVEAMRFKMILLSYLVRLPESLGFTVYGPFLDIDLAMAMLNLPDERRKNRIWQQEFMTAAGIDIENFGLAVDGRNYLDPFGAATVPLSVLDIPEELLPMLNCEMFGELDRLSSFEAQLKLRLFLFFFAQNKYVDKVCNKIAKIGCIRKFKNSDVHSQWLSSYNSYMTLHPLCTLFKEN